MRLPQSQLRRIVREVVEGRLTEARHGWTAELEYCSARAIADSIEHNVEEIADTIAKSLPPDALRPVRYEDVDYVADTVTKRVLNDQQCTAIVHRIVSMVLSDLLRSV